MIRSLRKKSGHLYLFSIIIFISRRRGQARARGGGGGRGRPDFFLIWFGRTEALQSSRASLRYGEGVKHIDSCCGVLSVCCVLYQGRAPA